MLIPTVEDLVLCVAQSLDEAVKPHVTERAARSAVQTSVLLLRHAALRVEREGQVLLDDARALRNLLPRIAEFLGTTESAEAPACIADIRRTLTAPYRDADAYVTLSSLGDEVRALRESLYGAQKLLLASRGRLASDPGYNALREGIRHYIAWRIQEDAQLVNPVYEGQGPRR